MVGNVATFMTFFFTLDTLMDTITSHIILTLVQLVQALIPNAGHRDTVNT